MKKYVLVCISVLSIVFTQAQNVTFTPKTQNVSGPNSGDFKANFGVKNNSSDPTDTQFTWTFLTFNKPSAWEINLCDPFECRYNVGPNESHSFTLAQGETGLFYGDFIPNGTDGVSNLAVIVKSNKNAANADTAYMNATAWVTAVKEVNKTKAVSFFPNPVKDQLTLKFQAKQSLEVEIYNILGVKVKTFVHEGASTQIAVGDLQNGVYFIRFNENGKQYIKQFVKAQ